MKKYALVIGIMLGTIASVIILGIALNQAKLGLKQVSAAYADHLAKEYRASICFLEAKAPTEYDERDKICAAGVLKKAQNEVAAIAQ